MGLYLDEPLAAMAATALTIGGAVIGAWWQRRRMPAALSAATARPALPDSPLEARFDRLEAIVEATAVEVERISEGQRFTTKLLAEGRAAGPPARPAPGRAGEHPTPH